MPELGPYGSVRGARGNSRPYRERSSVVQLLCVRNETRATASRKRAAHDLDECAPFHHSITSSARASSVGGMVRPSAFAVFRLITSRPKFGLIIKAQWFR